MMTRSKARRRRPRSPKPPPTPKKSTSTTSAAASMPTATTAQARAGARNPPETTPAAPSDQSKKRPSTVSKKAKMAWVDEWIKGDSEQKMNDDVAEEDEENMKDDDVVAGEEEEEEEAVSSAPSSPLCEPYIPNEIRGLGYDDRTHMAYKQALMPARSKYNEKRARQRKLPTLDLDTPGCGMRLGFGGGDRKHIPADGPEARKAVLDAARFVLGVSASVGGKRLGRGSCFWIDWDENDKTGIVLTTAGLILTESTLSFFGVAGYPDDVEEYADDAEVSGGSYAEKLGIRVGDVIECSNGEDIQTIFELENMLLSICKDHFGRGNDLNSKVDVVVC
ncbi:hypothetical protein ACQ4PT_049685 [Festuca glaucescens]